MFSTWTADAFRDQNNSDRRHIIDFERTIKPQGFVEAPGVDTDQLGYLEAWQFALDRHAEWRVHGFLVDHVFYIVWLDPEHLLCPRSDNP